MTAKYLLGLVGHPVAKSLSPPMHKAALRHCGLEGTYDLFDITADQLPAELDRLKQNELSGFNVTIPHKTAVLKFCHERSAAVERVGAANTIKIREDGTLFADNTDIAGFSAALSDAFNFDASTDAPSNSIACILGAGGAAKAAVDVLIEIGFGTVCVLARDSSKAKALCDDWTSQSPVKSQLKGIGLDDYATISGARLIVSTIPYGQTAELDKVLLKDVIREASGHSTCIFDMVYSRDGKETALVKLAQELNAKACDGTAMLVHQAMAAFKIWTEHSVPFEVMHQALVAARG